MSIALMALGAVALLEQKDAITDKPAAFAFVEDGSGNMLMIGCHKTSSSQLRVIFKSRQHLMTTGWLDSARPFTYRFDTDEPVTTDWYYDRDLVEKFSGQELRRFLRRFLAAERLAVRASNYEGDRVTAVFEITGAEVPVRKMLAICGDQKTTAFVFGKP